MKENEIKKSSYFYYIYLSFPYFCISLRMIRKRRTISPLSKGDLYIFILIYFIIFLFINESKTFL